MTETSRPKSETEAISWLVDRVPELRPFLQEHLADNCGELLSYVVFESDFLRWFIDGVRSGNHEPARRFVEAVEPLMTTQINPKANDRVWNLAGVCFAEALVMNGDDDVIESARPWMGPNTWEDVQHMFWYRSGKLPPTGS